LRRPRVPATLCKELAYQRLANLRVVNAAIVRRGLDADRRRPETTIHYTPEQGIASSVDALFVPDCV
jgi:hypothetical protein